MTRKEVERTNRKTEMPRNEPEMINKNVGGRIGNRENRKIEIISRICLLGLG